MPIIGNVDVMMAKRKISLGELAERIGITQANLSILKTGKAKAIWFSTLAAICKELDCKSGDIASVCYRDGKSSTIKFPEIEISVPEFVKGFPGAGRAVPDKTAGKFFQ